MVLLFAGVLASAQNINLSQREPGPKDHDKVNSSSYIHKNFLL
jgi:hypothetical protein